MAIRDEILRVLALQEEWSSENTPQMDERGKIVRTAIPNALRPFLESNSFSVGGAPAELRLQG